MPIGYVAAAAGIASSVNSLVGGGGSGGGGSNAPANQSYGGSAATYIPTDQPGADSMYQSIFNSMAPYASNLPSQVIPGYTAASTNIQNNPYASLQTSGANQVASEGQNVAGTAYGDMTSLNNAGNQIYQTAFDPQQALYNQLQNQTTQQAAAANAASGVTGPYAAGVTDQALQNFNINWQNQQLQRQATGEQAAGQAYSGATALGNAALGTLTTATSLPYQTYNTQQGNDISALNSLVSGTNAAFAPDTAEANLLQSYLGFGQSASQLAQAGQQQGFAQNTSLGSQFGQSLSSLSNLFSGSNPSGGLSSLLSSPQSAQLSTSNQGQSFSGIDPSSFNYYDPSGDYMSA